MANEIFKEIKTRIALRWLEYTTWSTEAFKAEKPLKGEVWFCEVPTGNANAQTAPTVLFKVGDGVNTFGDLKWGSALAADVYAWAKKATPDWTDFPALPIEVVDNGTGKFVTGITYANNKITITRANVALDDISDKEKIALAADLEDLGRDLAQLTNLVHDNKTQLTTTAATVVGAINEHDAEIGDLDDLNTTNKGNLVSAINEALQAVEAGGTGSVVTVTKAETPTTGSEATYVVNQGGKAVDVKIEIPKYATSADYGVLEVAAGDDTITIGGTAQNPTIAVTANKFDAYGAAAQALADAKDYADKKPHENTAHTHSVGDGLKKTGDGGIDGDVKYELNLKFGELNNNKLQLLDATNNAVVAEFDAAAFVEDSYLNEVTYKDENGDNILEFTFTLNDGSTKTVDVDLSHLVDVYTADETTITLTTSGDGKVFKVKEAGIETKHIKDGNVTEAKLEKNVTDALALARTALQSHQDITGKADKVTGAVAGNFAGLDANGNLVDSGKKAADFEVAGAAATAEQNAKDYADGLVENYGDIVTHDADEFATNAENGAKALADQNKLAIDAINNVDTGILAQAKKDAADKVAALAGEGNDTTVKAVADRVKALEDAEHISEVTTTANGGLKVTNKNQIDIDTDVVFVLDCNW